jgi:hypothetical protein
VRMVLFHIQRGGQARPLNDDAYSICARPRLPSRPQRGIIEARVSQGAAR